MTWVAWLVFVAVTGYTIWDGVRRTRGAKDLEGFFAAGRAIPWWAAGLSVMATQLSAITILSGVGLGYENGCEWVQFYFALPFAMVVLCIWFVPAYRRHPILTAYEFLERRFGPVTRSLTSGMFLLSRCLAFAVVLYAPAAALQAVDLTILKRAQRRPVALLGVPEADEREQRQLERQLGQFGRTIRHGRQRYPAMVETA